jgi:hypothetical protein
MTMVLFSSGLAESVVEPLQCGIPGAEISLGETV